MRNMLSPPSWPTSSPVYRPLILTTISFLAESLLIFFVPDCFAIKIFHLRLFFYRASQRLFHDDLFGAFLSLPFCTSNPLFSARVAFFFLYISQMNAVILTKSSCWSNNFHLKSVNSSPCFELNLTNAKFLQELEFLTCPKLLSNPNRLPYNGAHL